jgi:hypothetical protein
MTELDPSSFTFNRSPTALYESEHELKPTSLKRTPAGELLLTFQERVREAGSEQFLKLIYIKKEGRASRGPYLIKRLPGGASLNSSDVFYDPEREELITGWMETGQVEGDRFMFQFMQVMKTDLTSPPPCATTP